MNEKGVRGGIENFPALAGSERRGKSFPSAVHNLMRKGNERRWGESDVSVVVFYQDNNGFITPSELSHMMVTLGHELDPEEITEMIHEADMDDDGKIR